MNKRDRDETEATILLAVWETAFLIAVLIDTSVIWTAFVALCIMNILFMILEQQIERLERRVRREHSKFVEQSANYMHHVLSEQPKQHKKAA